MAKGLWGIVKKKKEAWSGTPLSLRYAWMASRIDWFSIWITDW